MSKKLTRILLTTIAAVGGLGLLNAWLNQGWDPRQLFTKRVAEETRFRVGFLPVT